MSGHSKWANIKHRKEAQDQKRGKIFSKFARLIAVAVKEGNSADPNSNVKLRLVLERARLENIPKENIQRAIDNAVKRKEAVEEVMLEGYGPGGIAIIVEAITDNRQRTIQEIKNLFQKHEGSLAEPGSVIFQFDKKGLVVVENPHNEERTLKIVDLGAEDIEELGDILEVWVAPSTLELMKQRLLENQFIVKKAEIVMKPKVLMAINDKSKAKSALNLIELIDDHDDVQQVYTNFDIPEELVSEDSN